MGSRTSECGSFAFESKIDLNHHLQFRYITTLPPNLTIHHPHPSSPSSPSNGVANGFSWTSQAFQLTFHLGNLSFRATHTKHTWKDGMGEWGGSLRKLGVVVLFCLGGWYFRLGLEILLLGILSKTIAVGELGLPRCVANGWEKKNKVMSCVPDMSGIGSTWSWRIQVKRLNVRTAQEKKTAVPRSLGENGPKVAWYNQPEKLC